MKKELALYFIKVVDGALSALIASPKAKAAVKGEMAALRLMVDEDRAPTLEEWAAHDTSMEELKNELHTD